jgi:hypothetical protein
MENFFIIDEPYSPQTHPLERITLDEVSFKRCLKYKTD